jgi:hypothetical protein
MGVAHNVEWEDSVIVTNDSVSIWNEAAVVCI